MLSRATLAKRIVDCETLRQELLNEAKHGNQNIFPPQVKALIDVKVALEKFAELDLESITDDLSPNYLESIRIQAEMTRQKEPVKINEQIKTEVFNLLPEGNRLCALSYEAKIEGDAFLALQDAAAIIDDLKRNFHKGIETVLSDFFIQEKKAVDAEIDVIPHQETTTFFSALRSMGFKKLVFKKKDQERIKQLIEQPVKKIKALFDASSPSHLLDPVIRGDCYPEKIQFSFSPAFYEMELASLLQYANNIIKKTGLYASFKFIAQERVGGGTFADYVHFKEKGMSFVIGKKEWIKREEEKYQSSVKYLQVLKSVKIKTKRMIEKSKKIITNAEILTKEIELRAAELLQKVRDEANKGRQRRHALQAELKGVTDTIKQLEEDNSKLGELLKNKEELLRISLLDARVFQEKKEDVAKSDDAIETLQLKISLGKKTASDQMNYVWSSCFARYEESYRGKLFHQLQEDYSDDLIPRYKKASAAMVFPLILDQLQREYSKKINVEKERIALAVKTRLVKMVKKQRQIQSEAREREQEVKDCPEFNAFLHYYHREIAEMNVGCEEIEKLHAEILLLDVRVDKVLSASKMENCRVAPVGLFWKVLLEGDPSFAAASLMELQAVQASLRQLSSDAQSKCEQIQAKREEVGRIKKKFCESLHKPVYDLFKASKNYREILRKFKEVEQSFEKPGIHAADSIEHNLLQRINFKNDELERMIHKKQLKLFDEFAATLHEIFSQENLKNFWQKKIYALGSLRTFINGARVSVHNEKGSVHLIAVPRGIYSAWTILTDSKSKDKKEKKLNDICLKIRKRLQDKKVYGRAKPTEILYSALEKFLEGDKLVVTEAKLAALQEAFTDENNKHLFNGLILSSLIRSRDMSLRM